MRLSSREDLSLIVLEALVVTDPLARTLRHRPTFQPSRTHALQMHGEGAVTGRHLDTRLDDGVVVEGVVVDDEPPVLHEHRAAASRVAGCDEYPVVDG